MIPPPPARLSSPPADIPRQSTVKLFCPQCEDVYYPRSKYHGNLDGGCVGGWAALRLHWGGRRAAGSGTDWMDAARQPASG